MKIVPEIRVSQRGDSQVDIHDLIFSSSSGKPISWWRCLFGLEKSILTTINEYQSQASVEHSRSVITEQCTHVLFDINVLVHGVYAYSIYKTRYPEV